MPAQIEGGEQKQLIDPCIQSWTFCFNTWLPPSMTLTFGVFSFFSTIFCVFLKKTKQKLNIYSKQISMSIGHYFVSIVCCSNFFSKTLNNLRHSLKKTYAHGNQGREGASAFDWKRDGLPIVRMTPALNSKDGRDVVRYKFQLLQIDVRKIEV